MKKLNLTIILVAFIFLNSFSQKLQVNQSQRYLETTDGKPFLWIGDTAWELFHKLNREEATEYLENRKAKGISVIQAVVLGAKFASKMSEGLFNLILTSLLVLAAVNIIFS